MLIVNPAIVRYMHLLRQLADVDWHHSHEQLVGALEELGSERAADALAILATRVSLPGMGRRVGSHKAMFFALERMGTLYAAKILEHLAQHSEGGVRVAAAPHLARLRTKLLVNHPSPEV